MLAADWGLADAFSSSLLVHVPNDVPVTQQMDVLRTHLNADQADTFQLINHQEDLLGFEHFKYQHYNNGLLVESSVYTVHARDGLIVSLSGEYHDVDNAPVSAAINEAEALKFALDHINASTYIWQDETTQQEQQFHTHANDGNGDCGPGCACGSCTGTTIHLGAAHDHSHNISFDIPQAELVYSGNSLAYKFDIYAVDPLSRAWIFVDATTGQIVDSHNQIHAVDVPATGATLYDSNVAFTADFTGSEYRLREAGGATAPGVQTYDLNESTSYGSAVDFVSATANFGDADHEVGNQTHWGTEQTWDYFFTQHGRDSYDDAGSPLISYVSYGSSFVNAFWNGSFMTYGDGNGVNRGPLVSLDIIGHEIAHGVTQFSAGLIYSNHSGALNESFSDIFGEAIENHARGNNDWLMGGDIGLNGNLGQFRSMQDPNLFNDPDTYLGDYWYTGNGDNGGVHINSGVQNKWFYIMVNGEAGTNDTGHTYNVTAVGMQDAGAIAYRNLTQYLTPNSTYPDARAGAIQAAIDLFGVGSQQHISTMEAWDAVGVYDPSDEFTLYPVNPRGSQIFAASAINQVAYDSDTVEFELALDANQLLTLSVVNQSGSLLPSVTITDADGFLVAAGTALTTADIIHFDSIPVPAADIYTITVAGDSGTSGFFDASLLLNAGLDVELADLGTNDTLATAQDLEITSLTQGYVPASIVDRLAVQGELVGGPTVSGGDEGFESGILDPLVWETFSSTPNGRIAVASDTGTPYGNFALSMDVSVPGLFNLNEAIMTLDLTGITDVDLGFSHTSFGDESHFLPASFVGSINGDGVSISEDGLVWHTVWTNDTPPHSVWQDVVIDLDMAASDAGIALGADFKVKFQQYDNFSRNSDGRAFDNILVGGSAVEDWYSFEIDPGESITVAATEIGGTPGALGVQLYDAAETLLANAVAGAGVITSYIDSFVSASAVTETVYLKVVGNTDLYSLVVTRGGVFDLEDGFDQDITGLQGAIGYVSGSILTGAEPDDAVAGTAVDAAFAGVTLSNEVSGGSIFAVASAFPAPTGDNVFSRTASNPSGFREGSSEFRADFDNLQAYVSIDVGSDDTLDVAFLRAYDSSGTLLQEVIGSGAAIGESETLTISRPVADISYVIAAGVGSHTAPLDNLVFEEQVLDSDVYLTDVTAGEEVEFRTYLPGEGPFEFENRLAQPGGNEIRMILFDPAGTSVAFDSDVISHKAEMTGTYELLVFANRFDGEYYVTRDIGIATVSAWGVKFLDGGVAGGTLSDAALSDDAYYQIVPSITSNPYKQKIEMILLADSPVLSPTSFGFRLEASMTGGPEGDVIQTVELWDELNSVWELVDTRAVSNTESVIDISASGNLDRFVHPLTGEIQSKITYISPDFVGAPYNWSIDIDQSAWRVGQY